MQCLKYFVSDYRLLHRWGIPFTEKPGVHQTFVSCEDQKQCSLQVCKNFQTKNDEDVDTEK